MNKYYIKNGKFVEVSEDELMHWKYIKREKKNGKWVYYYDSDSLKNDAKGLTDRVKNAIGIGGKERVEQARKANEQAQKGYRYLARIRQNAKDESQSAYKKADRKYRDMDWYRNIAEADKAEGDKLKEQYDRTGVRVRG